VLNEKLGLDPTTVQYIDGDTDRVAFGIGINGSRSTVIGGSALWMAADKVIAKGKRIVAHLLEAADIDIEFADGNFSVAGTDRRVSITDVAKRRSSPALCRQASKAAFMRPAPSPPTTTPIPMVAMSAKSRSTPIPERWRSCATS
jgi:aerobic carbon-monoxide dehydrogenase large subunit